MAGLKSSNENPHLGMFSLALQSAKVAEKHRLDDRIMRLRHWLSDQATSHQCAILNLIGVLQYYARDRLKAVQTFQQVLDMDTNNLNALANIVFVYERLIIPEKATVYRTKRDSLLQAEQDHQNVIVRCIAEQAHAWSCELVETRDYESHQRSNELYQKAIELGEEGVDEEELMVWYYNLALNHKRMCFMKITNTVENEIDQKKWHFKEAIVYFHKVLESKYKHYRASTWCNLGSMFTDIKYLFGDEIPQSVHEAQLDNYYKNPKDCQSIARDLCPSDLYIMTKHAEALSHSGMYDDAIQRLDKSIETDPRETNQLAYKIRAKTYIQKNKNTASFDQTTLTNALTDLEKIYEWVPDDIQNLCTLAEVHSKMSRKRKNQDQDTCQTHKEKSLEYLMNAVSFSDTNSSVHFRRAACLKQLGCFTQASEGYKRAIENDTASNRFGELNICNLLACQLKLYRQNDERDKSLLYEMGYWLQKGFIKYNIQGYFQNQDRYFRGLCRKYQGEITYMWEALLRGNHSLKYIDLYRTCLNTLKESMHGNLTGIAVVDSLLDFINSCEQEDVTGPMVSHRLDPQHQIRMEEKEDNVNDSQSVALAIEDVKIEKQPQDSRNSKQLLYDFFVIHSSENNDWVRYSLLPILEREHGFKGCVADRDFIPGEAILDNIDKCINNSICSLVVLTPACVDSQWCKNEIINAKHKAVGENYKVIPILLETCDIPSQLKQLTYLDALDQCDWLRLVDALDDLM